MYAVEAMDLSLMYILGHKKSLFYLVLLVAMGFDFQTESGHYLASLLLLAALVYAQKTMAIIQLDSDLMDLQEADLEDTGYNNPLVDITLDSYANDDEGENNMLQYTQVSFHD
jgi:hypothetical protein